MFIADPDLGRHAGLSGLGKINFVLCIHSVPLFPIYNKFTQPLYPFISHAAGVNLCSEQHQSCY